MITISNRIYPHQFDRLESIILAVENGNLHEARSLTARMFDGLTNIQSLAERLQTELFLNAINSRIDKTLPIENLYLVPDQGQQIQMFNLMAEKFPVVRHAQHIANTLYLERIRQDQQFVILDIGVGTGQQIASLIERIVEQQTTVKQITVLGIEPSGESLAKAKMCFSQLSEKHPVVISFTGIQKTVEDLNEQDWDLLRERIQETDGKLLINASFAMHHVHPLSFRTRFFMQLKALNPDRFIIIEPYADYTSDSLMERFLNSWHHYGLTFSAIDTIDATDAEKSMIKHVFFGREMVDVLGEGSRVEQFETAEMWVDRLVEAGFSPLKITHDIPDDFNPKVRIAQAGSYLGFNVEGYPIIGVIGAD